MVTVAGNPMSCPDGDRLDAVRIARVHGRIDYLNETTRHADVILPPPSHLQKPHFDLFGLSIRNVANYSPAVLPLDDDQLPEWQLACRLRRAGRLDGDDAGGPRSTR